MSSLGYAMAFMICAHDGQGCEMVGVRASRFATVAQCRATIVDALRVAARSHAARAGMTASCHSLDEMCSPHHVASSRSIARQVSTVAYLKHVRFEASGRSSVAIDSALAMLCKKRSETDCSA